jgi:PAS domain S-box-containing protein
VSPATLPE